MDLSRTDLVAHWPPEAVAGLLFAAGWALLWVSILEPVCAPGAVRRHLGGRSAPKAA
jgi:hypothetical protein